MPSSDADPVGSVVEPVRRALLKARLAINRRPVVLAVSGGADSLCLLDVVVTVRGEARPNVVVGHVDHRLRPDSADDAAHVRAIAERRGLPCEVATVDMPALAEAERRGVEEAARIGRYRALSRIARKVGATAILTGHTRSDSVETVLLHLLRGSGPRGLRGIEPVEDLDPALSEDREGGARRRPLRLVRPLLDLDRAATAAYCAARSITWRVDVSNADARFGRNRVRQHLLPVLRTFNPAIDGALGRLAETAADDERWIDGLVERAARRVLHSEEDGVTADLAAWERLPLALRRRLVLHTVSLYRVSNIGFEAVERALRVAEGDGPRRAELGGGLTFERVGGRLIFRHKGRT